MRNAASGDVWKVWLYAAAALGLGAWVSPVLYDAGKALAEVSASKTTNGPLAWLAGVCREAGFAEFYKAAVLLAAVVLFLPWMEWLRGRSSMPVAAGEGPWGLRIPRCVRIPGRGQRLWRNLRGPWQVCAGFLLVGGVMLPLGMVLVPAGFFTMRHPGEGAVTVFSRMILAAGAAALVMEVVFRGVAMGIFLRAMRPAVAIGMSAVLFALVFSMMPPRGWGLADPEASGAGFEVMRGMWLRFGDWRAMATGFLPMAVLGLVLSYARWRTASLWLPVGLHTGWLFGKRVLADLSVAGGNVVGTPDSAVAGQVLQQGVIPLLAIVLAGLLAHYLAEDPPHECALES